MEAVNVLSAPTNRPENLVEVSDLIRLSLHLTGLVQKRFRVYGYAREADVMLNIRNIMAEVFVSNEFLDAYDENYDEF